MDDEILARALCEQFYVGMFARLRIDDRFEDQEKRIDILVDNSYPLWFWEAKNLLEKLDE